MKKVSFLKKPVVPKITTVSFENITKSKLKTSKNWNFSFSLTSDKYISFTPINDKEYFVIMIEKESKEKINTYFLNNGIVEKTEFRDGEVFVKEEKINKYLRAETCKHGGFGGNGDCGQDVSDCISDAYTQHGWSSVYLWIQTAAIWQTGVAIAAACAYKNCLHFCTMP